MSNESNKPKVVTASLPDELVKAPSLPKLDPLNLNDFSLNIDYYLKTNYQSIFHASSELPAVIEWVNSCLQDYSQAKLDAKHRLEVAEAEEYIALKHGGYVTKYNGAKPTEEGVKHAVALNPAVQSARNEYIAYSTWVGRLQNLIYSLQAKLDLVRSSESTRRALEDKSTIE